MARKRGLVLEKYNFYLAMKKVKALVLFSGGLDSMLAVKILQDQGIEVEGVCFESNFFNAAKARKLAQEINIRLKIKDISRNMLELVKNPPSGYGKHLNPCLDCHSLMIREAGKIKAREKYDFIATGEVLGQRPFSQNRQALERVSKLSGTEVLRPLSAKLLPETSYEKKEIVRRGRLYRIQGRRREEQMELARKYNVEKYSSPAGGCLLTDPDFSERLIKLLDNWPDCSTNDAALLKRGRVFWLKDKKQEKILIIIGRHQEDNEELEKLARGNDIMLELKEINGPISIIRGANFTAADSQSFSLKIDVPKKLKLSELKLGQAKERQEILNISALLTGYYATKARGRNVELRIKKRELFNNANAQ